MLKRAILFLFLLSFVTKLCGQSTREFMVQEVVSLFDKTQTAVYKYLSEKGYSYKRKEEGFEIYEHKTGMGTLQLTLVFKNSKATLIGTHETYLVARQITSDLLNNFFEVESSFTGAKEFIPHEGCMYGLRNKKLGLTATYIISKFNPFIVAVNYGRDPKNIVTGNLSEKLKIRKQQLQQKNESYQTLKHTDNEPRARWSGSNSQDNAKNNLNTKAIDLFKINSSSELIDHFGNDNVEKVKAVGYEGEDLGYEYQIFPKTSKEAFFYFSGERLDRVSFVKESSYWELPYNLRVGMVLKEVQEINKKSFIISPMETHGSGLVLSWGLGSLAESGISVRFKTTKDKIPNYNEFMSSNFKSDKKNINTLGLVVEEIRVFNPVYNN